VAAAARLAAAVPAGRARPGRACLVGLAARRRRCAAHQLAVRRAAGLSAPLETRAHEAHLRPVEPFSTREESAAALSLMPQELGRCGHRMTLHFHKHRLDCLAHFGPARFRRETRAGGRQGRTSAGGRATLGAWTCAGPYRPPSCMIRHTALGTARAARQDGWEASVTADSEVRGGSAQGKTAGHGRLSGHQGFAKREGAYLA